MEQLQFQSDTPGNIVTFLTGMVFPPNYDFDTGRYSIKINYSILREENTYINILNVYNDHYNKKVYDTLISSPNIKIIWTSQMAVNKRKGHGTIPRNMLVVWEYIPLKENESS